MTSERAETRNLPGGSAPRIHLPRPVIVVLIIICLFTVIPNVILWQAFHHLRQQRDKEHLFWLLCQPGYTEAERRQAFSELLWQGNLEWRSARLTRLDLTGTQLMGASIRQADMAGCKLAGANLSGAVLRGTQLDQADLSNADLTNADLYECDLLKADLRDADLTGCDLRGADIGQSNAAGAKFVSADLTTARLDLAVLKNADLRFAKLIEADLSVADLSSTTLFGTDLSGADLRQANLHDANWWRAVGLSSQQLADFIHRYPPSPEATQQRQEDFEQWLAEFQAYKPAAEQPQPTPAKGS